MRDTLTLLWHYLRVRHFLRFRDRTALKKHQNRKLARFFKRNLHKSAFYRPFINRPLADFPIMDKPKMLANFAALNMAHLGLPDAMAEAEMAEESRDFTPKINGVSVGLSTGTSGTRGVFLVSDRERMGWAGTILGRMLPGSILSSHRIAFFLRANNNLYESVASRGRIQFEFFDLMRGLPTLTAALAAYNPTILIAPAQVLSALAKAQKAGQIALRPAKIISVAEVLYDDEATKISAAFGLPVSQVYQCTEGFLGYTCAHNRLHLNEALMMIEPDWLDDKQERFCPIITDFSRQTQLFIRHRLDDILTNDPRPCPCGSPERVIKRIEGRTDDVLVLRSLTGIPTPLMPDYVTRALAACPQVEDFRVEQTAETTIIVALHSNKMPAAIDAAKQALEDLCRHHHLTLPSIEFIDELPQVATQKRRRVLRVKSIDLPRNMTKS